MSFEQHLQQWVAIDNQMKVLGDRMKELRDKKNTLSQSRVLFALKYCYIFKMFAMSSKVYVRLTMLLMINLKTPSQH